MNWLSLLMKFLHVAAVIVWVGGVFALAVLNARLGRAGDAAERAVMARRSEDYGRVAIGPAMGLTLIAGIAAAWSFGYPFNSLWIIWGVLAMIGSGLVMTAIGRSAAELGALMPRASEADSRIAALRGRLTALNALNLLLLASAVWAMVFKPTL